MGRPAKIKVAALKTCKKCGTRTDCSFVIGHTQIKLCTTCYGKWLDVKDKAVGAAFESYFQT